MAKGRNKKSKELDKLHGNPGHRKKKSKTLPSSQGKLGLPRGLSKGVQRHCSKMAKYLKESGAPIDLIRPMFERYCKCLELAAKAYKNLDTDKGASKAWKDNGDAALKIEKQFETLLRKATPPKPKESPLEAFRKKGKKLEAVK